MKPKILVVTHDAGASEYLAHMVLKEREKAAWSIYAMPESPAIEIFRNLSHKYTDVMYMLDDGTIINPGLASKKELKIIYLI